MTPIFSTLPVFLLSFSQVEAVTRQKLKNPNVFVSSTRLCVRNIPTSVDDQSLKKIFLKQADNPAAKISEVFHSLATADVL